LVDAKKERCGRHPTPKETETIQIGKEAKQRPEGRQGILYLELTHKVQNFLSNGNTVEVAKQELI